MIRIVRGPAPRILEEDGVRACRALCEQVERDGDRYRLRFDAQIYGDAAVLLRLREMQAGKCCYCERSVDRGTIEHYRPKGAVFQDPGRRESARGYYWLAYAWDNLLLACNECNTTHKRELFPLEDPGRRVRHHGAAELLSEERPLLLDPTRDDPAQHIRFERFTPVAQTDRGRATIAVLKLDRAFLEAEREARFALLTVLLDMLELMRHGASPASDRRGVYEQLIRLSSARETHAGMLRAEFRRRLGHDVELPLTHAWLRAWVGEPADDVGAPA